MIIIIEGPDGSGKSTLANRFSEQTGYPIIHMDKPKSKEEEDNMFDMYVDMLKKHRNAIIDRCWYSDMVYGPIMRGRTPMDYPKMYALEKMLARKGAMLVYCHGPEGKLWERCTRRGEDYITDKTTHSKICKSYKKLMDCPHLIPKVLYEISDM